MKIKVAIDNGANAHSLRTDVLDFEDLGCTEEHWKEMTEEDRWKLVESYWHSQGAIEIWYEELKDSDN